MMVDKSAVELKAIATVFPEAKPLLCAFHRIQAWRRWLVSKQNGIPQKKHEHVLTLLATIADASSQQQLKEAIALLENDPLFEAHSTLRQYWRDHWGNCLELWVQCFRKVRYCLIDYLCNPAHPRQPWPMIQLT
jgi:hypothetical protein